MNISFQPDVRLAHLEDYVLNIHLNLPFEEARIQLLRCRLVAYKLAAELNDGIHNKAYVDDLMKKAYGKLGQSGDRELEDPYLDPCASQYYLLDELRSYSYWDRSDHFMEFLRSEFKKIFIPTLRLLTELCKSENKYSWEEVKTQLQPIMDALKVTSTWDECETYLERYLDKISNIIEL
ncbi:MAG: hypothetical protein MUO26_02580 [Methanotrichaceae archaeon]|nr:hypothetical protein [Methanotrichaceae archaeon]